MKIALWLVCVCFLFVLTGCQISIPAQEKHANSTCNEEPLPEFYIYSDKIEAEVDDEVSVTAVSTFDGAKDNKVSLNLLIPSGMDPDPWSTSGTLYVGHINKVYKGVVKGDWSMQFIALFAYTAPDGSFCEEPRSLVIK